MASQSVPGGFGPPRHSHHAWSLQPHGRSLCEQNYCSFDFSRQIGFGQAQQTHRNDLLATQARSRRAAAELLLDDYDDSQSL